MNNRLLNKWLIVTALVLVACWLFWPSAGKQPASEIDSATQTLQGSVKEASLVSAIEPITVTDETALHIKQQFSKGFGLIKQGQLLKASELLQQLIKQHPTLVEPYVNLAVIYAKNKQLEKAQQVLTAGLEANKNYQLLFSNLQKVHGVLAANAYRKALDENDAIETVDLSMIDNVSVMPLINEDIQRQQADRERSKRLEAELAKLQQDIETQKEALLVQHKLELSQMEQTHEQLLATQLTEKETVMKQELARIQGEATLQQQTDRNKIEQLKADIVKRDQEAEQQMRSLLAANEREIANLEQINAQQKKQASLQSQTTTPPNSHVKSVDEVVVKRNDIAINLVKSWANAWSEQDVDSYLSHYAENYRPANGLTHQKWRQQRQQRLTNKQFINVTVKDFDVVDQNDRFSVGFYQHYQSNTLDDTIYKRLIFVKQGDDWRNAKVIDEAVVLQ